MDKLTDAQQKIDRRIAHRMQEAGWKLTHRGELFETADLEYQSGPLKLGVVYRWTDESVSFTLEHDAADESLALKIVFEDCLDELLDTIVEWQDRVTPDDYGDLLDAIVRTCPETWGIRGDDLVKLEADDT